MPNHIIIILFHLFLIYVIDYAITVVLIFPPLPPPPGTPHSLWQYAPFNSCPRVMYISSMAPPLSLLALNITMAILYLPICTFKKYFIYSFSERGERREKERKTSMCKRYWLPLTHPQLGTWPATQARMLTWN